MPTRSPTWRDVTPSPTATISPTPSCPNVHGNGPDESFPSVSPPIQRTLLCSESSDATIQAIFTAHDSATKRASELVDGRDDHRRHERDRLVRPQTAPRDQRPPGPEVDRVPNGLGDEGPPRRERVGELPRDALDEVHVGPHRTRHDRLGLRI